MMMTLLGGAAAVTMFLTQPDPAIADAKRIFELWRGGKADAVAAEFNDKMAAAITADQLAQFWPQVEQQAGAFQKLIDEKVTSPEPGITAVILGVQFERGVANCLVVFDAQKKIAGLSIRPRPAQVRR